MGTFENALKRELGKNTGKAISNFVFGDAHSTPYRRTSSRRSSPPVETYTPRKTAKQLKEEHLALMLEKERDLAYKELLRKQQLEEEHQREIFRLEQEAERNRVETENLNQLSREIELALNLNITDFSDAKSFLNNIAAKLTVRNWNNLSFFNSLLGSDTKKDKERKKMENQLYDIYLSKFQMVLEESVQILTNTDIDIYSKFLSQFCKKRKISPRVQLVNILETQKTTNLQTNKQQTVLLNTLSSNDTVNVDTIKNINSDNTSTNEDIVSVDIVNLNKCNIIENRLEKIWKKYETVIGNQAERRPIFVVDAIKNSILYIGVNPNFYEGDDDILLHSANGRALFYENVCGEPNPPEYFRKLEQFTRGISADSSYSHLNLLYARENDRNYLLSLDSNFIREQLELTYDLIMQINPPIIIFFSDYCKHLIFGKERWIDPDSLNKPDGYYTLNGTQIPVLFTEDVTTLDEPSYLQNKIKNILL